MAGNTATIDVAQFRSAWASHVPIRQLCVSFTVTRDQVTRLKFVWELPPRHDRALRWKPGKDDREPDPDADEVAASESTLDLAPWVADQVTAIHAMWTDRTWEERRVEKTPEFRVARTEVPEEYREMIDDLNRECQW
jgi:hypothetical protein